MQISAAENVLAFGSAAASWPAQIRKREIIIHNDCEFYSIFIICLYLLLCNCDFSTSKSCAVTLDVTLQLQDAYAARLRRSS